MIRVDQDSVVGIATRYGLDDPAIEPQLGGGAGICSPVQTDPGAHPASCKIGTQSPSPG